MKRKVEVIGSIVINPAEVEHVLNLADFKYPKRYEAEQLAGWTNTPVIPRLYNWCAQNGSLPRPDEGVAFLLQLADKGTNIFDDRIIKRGQKLFMDFCREVHTMGLLQRCPSPSTTSSGPSSTPTARS